MIPQSMHPLRRLILQATPVQPQQIAIGLLAVVTAPPPSAEPEAIMRKGTGTHPPMTCRRGRADAR